MDRRSRFSPDPLPRDLHSLRARAASQPPRSTAVHSDGVSFTLPTDSLPHTTLHRTTQSPVRDRPPAWGQRLGRSPVVTRVPPIRSASFSAGNVPEDELWQAGPSIQATFDEDDEESLLDTWPNGDGANGAEPRSWGGSAQHDTTHRFRNPIHAPGARSRSLVANFTNPVPIGSHSLGAGLNRASDWGDRSSPYHESMDSRFLHEFSPRANGTRSHSLQSAASMPIALGTHRGIANEISNMSPFVRDRMSEEPRYHDAWGSLASMREEELGGMSGTTSRRHSVSIVQPRARGVGFAAPTGAEEGGAAQRYGLGRATFSDEELAGDFSMMNLNGSLQQTGLPERFQQTLSFPYSVPTRMPAQSPPRSRLSAYHAALEQQQAALDMHPQERHRSPSVGRSPGDTRFPTSGYTGLTQALNSNGQDDRETRQRSLSPYRSVDSRGPSPGDPLSPNAVQQPLDSARFDQQQFHHQQYSSEPGSNHNLGQPSAGGQGGVSLDDIPPGMKLVAVEFKLGRKELFYIDIGVDVKNGDRLVVEGDRGKDIGTVVQANVDKNVWIAGQFQHGPNASRKGTTEVAVPANPHQKAKRAYGVASPQETQDWAKKEDDEQKALQLCQSKVRQKKLPMQVVDCEFQWDRRKLTFYFIAETRIDFRDLVRELFRLYKTRIWMSCVSGPLAAPGVGPMY